MKKISLLAVFAVMLGIGGIAFAQETEKKDVLTVTDSAVCTAIADRMPEGKAAEFGKDVTKLYYWTKIEGANESTEVKHIWYSGDKAISEVPLKITMPSFRTWSSKTIYPGLEGDMSVEVVDADGNVLKKDTFKIQ